MIIRMQQKFFGAILAAATLAVIGMFIVVQWSLDRGFLEYVNKTEQDRISAAILQAYQEHGNWDFLQKDPEQWPASLKKIMRTDEEEPELLLLDEKLEPLFGNIGAKKSDRLAPLTHNGSIVSYLLIPPKKKLSEAHQVSFVKQQQVAMLLIAVIILCLSIFFSLLTARRLVRPINTLARGIHQLSAGNHAVRVPVYSSDELGKLAHDFNNLALVLEYNEKNRRQWIVDISHELRTPLAILRGEIEALQDGVRKVDAAAFESLHTEILQLNRLVDDLYQLSMHDVGMLSYDKASIEPLVILHHTIDQFRPEFARKNIELSTSLPSLCGTMYGDQERVRQLFANLLENNLKYTTPGGKLEIIAEHHGDQCSIIFQDSAPGVLNEELARLFERLYRVEASRSRKTGGMGLGLAICHNIATAHEGTITADHSPLGGLLIRIQLPLMKEQ